MKFFEMDLKKDAKCGWQKDLGKIFIDENGKKHSISDIYNYMVENYNMIAGIMKKIIHKGIKPEDLMYLLRLDVTLYDIYLNFTDVECDVNYIVNLGGVIPQDLYDLYLDSGYDSKIGIQYYKLFDYSWN